MSLQRNHRFARSPPSAPTTASTAPAPLPSACFTSHPRVVGGHQPCSYSGWREAKINLGPRSRTLDPLKHPPSMTSLCPGSPNTLEAPHPGGSHFCGHGWVLCRPLGPQNLLPFPSTEKYLLHHAPPFVFNPNVTFKELPSVISAA